jgi:hypothetical protein
MKDLVKVVVQIAAGVAVGTMAHDVVKNCVEKPIKKIMNSKAKDKGESL